MKKYGNEKGFTLIELMIIVAIIGILSAIAIPNFISYRNKAFCSLTESDAQNIAAAVSDYFAVPSHSGVPALNDLNGGQGVSLTAPNTLATIEAKNADLNEGIIIRVWDGSGRCPEDYQQASANTNGKGVWGAQAYALTMD